MDQPDMDQPDDDSNLVDEEDACPICSERRADFLLWLDDENVECQMCGTVYKPGQDE